MVASNPAKVEPAIGGPPAEEGPIADDLDSEDGREAVFIPRA